MITSLPDDELLTKPEEGPLAGQSKNLANINLLYNSKPGNWLATFQ